MKRTKIIIFTMIVILIGLLSGCSNSEGNENKGNLVKIPRENKIELEKIWEIKMDRQQSDFTIEGDKLYVVTWENIVYIIDINNGEIFKKIELDSIDDEYCSGVSIYNGNLAINYNNRIIVLDTNKESIISEYEVTKRPVVALEYNILMKDNLLIFSHIFDQKIYAMDYRTGKIQWEIGGDASKHGSLRLHKYKDKFLYTKGTEFAYYEFDPFTGNTIDKYEYTSGGEIKNENQSYFIPVFHNIKDDDFRNWLINKSFYVFNLTDKGYIYTKYGQNFYLHDINGVLQWQIKLPKKIRVTDEYGRYVVLNLRDAVSIFDIETKEIIWNIDYAIASKPRTFIHEDRLYLPGEDGSFKVFDLSKLEE